MHILGHDGLEQGALAFLCMHILGHARLERSVIPVCMHIIGHVGLERSAQPIHDHHRLSLHKEKVAKYLCKTF
jgi:hypothetical protein